MIGRRTNTVMGASDLALSKDGTRIGHLSTGGGGFNPWFGSTPVAVIKAVDAAVAAAGFGPAVWVESIEICQSAPRLNGTPLEHY